MYHYQLTILCVTDKLANIIKLYVLEYIKKKIIVFETNKNVFVTKFITFVRYFYNNLITLYFLVYYVYRLMLTTISNQKNSQLAA